jgi:hypothetical protein
MHINEDAVSFAAFSLAKVLVAELLRRILDATNSLLQLPAK